MVRAWPGFSSMKSRSRSPSSPSTAPLTSEDTSFSLVWEENFGSGTFTDSTAVSPSRASSPVSGTERQRFRPSFSM